MSEMTVSRVLAQSRRCLATARASAVLEAAKRLAMCPTRSPALGQSRVNLVAVVIPSMSNMVFPEVMTGISKILEGTELQPVVGLTDYLPEKEEKVLYEMLSWRPSGVIVAGLEHSDASRAMLRASGIPVVEIMDTDGTPVDSGRRDLAPPRRSADGRGHSQRRLQADRLLGTKMPLDHRARKRFEGFTQALAKGGIEIADQEFYSGGSALVKGREMTEAMLWIARPDLDFLYYSNDMIGAGGLMYLWEKGVDIPGQIGLAGFNGLNLLKGLPRELASMDACRLEIGRRAAEIIAKRVDEQADTPEPTRIVLEPTITYGDTLRRP